MITKAVSVAAVLATPGDQRDTGMKPPNSNRFMLLRDRSRSVSVSGRLPSPSPAAKRRAEDEAAKAGKAARIDANSLFLSMEVVEKKIAQGRKAADKLKSSLIKDESCNSFLKEFLGGVIDSLDSMADAVEALSSVAVDGQAAPLPPHQSGDKGKHHTSRSQVRDIPVEPTPAEVKKKKFISTVREAEKSVLVFGLDLGKVPTMNTGTLARKVTEDITAKASVVDGKTNGRPKEDTVAVLEDTLSMMKGMEFFGKVTKPYANKNNADDAANGTFHSLPVKMMFKDKDAKMVAEKVLRSNCKVNCTTPYPIMLRKAIKRTIDSQKVSFPDEFIQVKVDPEAGALKVSRRLNGKWTNDTAVIALSEADMDLSNGRSTVSDAHMEVEGAQPPL